MNTLRCLGCGEDISVASASGELTSICPRCGRQAAPADEPAAVPRPWGPEFFDFLAPAEQEGELGRLGSYRVLRILGAGGMGVVYEAEDVKLQRRVALKAMQPALAASRSARERFLREARAAASVEHERIVPIYQVDEDRGIPFLVMPLLRGETLENRLSRFGSLGSAESIRIGREIAEALAAAHGRGLIHRDVKPANVWLEGTRASVKLLDFGLARAAEATGMQLTQQGGTLYGTPAFMAPEQVDGGDVDYRTDLFALGCILYRMSAGKLPFAGKSAFAILQAVTEQEPSPPSKLVADIPAQLSQLVMRLLAKNPADRPASAQMVLDVLGGITLPARPSAITSSAASPDSGPMLSTTAQVMQAPGSPSARQADSGPMLSTTARVMQAPGLPSGPQPDSEAMLSATARLLQPPDAALVPLADAGTPGGGPSTDRVVARDTMNLAPAANTERAEPTAPPPGQVSPSAGGPAASTSSSGFGYGKILSAALSGAAVVGLAVLLLPRFWQPSPSPPPPAVVEIGIAYGSEKENWFKEAKDDFAASPEGGGIKINLIRVGSVKGGQILTTSDGERIHAWSPAHSIYKARFVQDWQVKHPGRNPILKEESLCLTPMVIVFWKDRHDAFLARYRSVSFEALIDAMDPDKGWGHIAGKQEWGRFRFGMAHPGTSNSALMGLLLLACEMNGGPGNDERLRQLVGALKSRAEIAPSTDKLMKEMVSRGPTAFDAVLIYENLAIDYLKAAEDRSGDLYVAYPRSNILNDNPYYILDVPWSSPEQRLAADAFLAFLLSAKMQQKALSHGFRPANIHIPIRDHADSPFVRHEKSGLRARIDSRCELGQAAILDELLRAWDKGP